MKFKCLTYFIPALFLLLTAVPGHAEDLPLLFLENDGKSLEIQIHNYLEEKKGWKLTRRWMGEDKEDLVLIFKGKYKGTPIFLFIDSSISAVKRNKKTGKETLLEKVIKVRGSIKCHLGKSKKKKALLLEAMNHYKRNYWNPPSLYLDKNNNITYQWPINIAGDHAPIHAGQVLNVVQKLIHSVHQYIYPMKKKFCS
ncbi:hypothetical protein [Magnetococcus sp. PR-3]|uniref:hypothetical protein n=1 Tax=Magnetococcus sp. PR-3 TaxID=3120355 RepID=UPI002FCE3492